jgi:hypothetical protein
MRKYFLLLVISLSFMSLATLAQQGGDIISDPNVSLKCKELIKERNDKINVKQRLKDLLKRTEKLISKTPRHKQTTLAKLRMSYQKLRNEIYLVNIIIQSREENIVRRGCPGIRL